MGIWVTLLALFALASSPLQAHARNSQYFSKVSRADPQTRTTEQALPPSASPFFKEEATPELGYGLFGKKEETYEYPPTTSNPTKSFKPNTGAKEKQGMSDTRFLENGKYFYNLENENEEDSYNARLMETNHALHSWAGPRPRSRPSYASVTAEKQGMSDTRFLENGRYFYDINAEAETDAQKYNGYSNNAELYTNDKYEGEEEEDSYDDDELYGSRETQVTNNGARFADNGRYYNEKSNEYYQDQEKERYAPEKESVKSGKGYDFRGTPNKFPEYEFDSIEEYEKYEQGRSHQKEYTP